ncbi:Hypothetical protein PHPALM_9415 [Phytophthora palmivora]|uniref:Uncharacterized protein n=1 Tax=Phytophthora palmivora TaxID=4796 RepID=A0A2P4Y7D1_9STRA|nr:Hypothetical protein PHPALM_9415 [Phytophthora palmivora]
MTAARGTKALRQAWAELAEEVTQLNNGDIVSVEQCRNKLKALRNKWMAHHAGMASEPVGIALMDALWGDGKEVMTSPRQSRPSPEHPKHVKKPRVASTSTSDVRTKALTPIAPAPAPVLTAVSAPTPLTSASASVSAATPTSTSEPTTSAASQADSGVSKVHPAQPLDVVMQEFTHIASTTSEAAQPTTNPSLDNEGLSKIEKLLDDRFAKVLEGQEKQLQLMEVQNKLLGQLLAVFQRDE